MSNNGAMDQHSREVEGKSWLDPSVPGFPVPTFKSVKVDKDVGSRNYH